MLGRKAIFICCLLWCLFSSNALATTKSIDHLGIPAFYDNVGGPWDYGQTFIAQDAFVSGFQVFIGDPSRPNDPSVNTLVGPANLVLYNASDLSTPIEIALRSSVVPSGTIVAYRHSPLKHQSQLRLEQSISLLYLRRIPMVLAFTLKPIQRITMEVNPD